MRACWILSGVRCSGKSAGTAEGLPFLTVVMPVFNEEEWIERSLQSVVDALGVANWPAEILVVDDGSTDRTTDILLRLGRRLEILAVISQPNSGRFAARRAGIEAANGEYILLVDGRVIVDPDSLSHLAGHLRAHPQRRVWNGHITVAASGKPYGHFWSGLVAVAWRRYFQDPRVVRFGLEEFDLYPKGTGFLLVPRSLLVEALGSFSSLYADQRLASDDTRLLRWIAGKEDINLSPGFSAEYVSRDSLIKYVKHSFFRGTTFVDGYLDSPGVARRNAGIAAAAGLAGLLVLAVRPRLALILALGGQGAAAALVRKCGGSREEARAVGVLLPLFALCFGTGVLRGLGLVLARRNHR